MFIMSLVWSASHEILTEMRILLELLVASVSTRQVFQTGQIHCWSNVYTLRRKHWLGIYKQAHQVAMTDCAIIGISGIGTFAIVVYLHSIFHIFIRVWKYIHVPSCTLTQNVFTSTVVLNLRECIRSASTLNAYLSKQRQLVACSTHECKKVLFLRGKGVWQ